MGRWPLVAVAALLAATPVLAQPAPAPLSVTPAGRMETVFDWSQAACEPSHVPDAPARAFRRADGTVALIASHNDNRLFKGGSLDALQPDCDIVFEAARSADLARYDDLAWISSIHTTDGRTVHALAHAELRGDRARGLCPTGDYSACLFNTVTALVSRDGGETFQVEGDGPAVVAALPYRFPTDRTSRVGYANPTNIVTRDGWHYAMMFADGYRAQTRGVCLIRTRTLDDPSSWRAWDGEGFGARFVDPFGGTVGDPQDHVCAPVGRGVIGRMVGGIVEHRPSGRVIAVFGDRRRDARGRAVSGIYASTSDDLIGWTRPTLVLEAPLLWEDSCDGGAPLFYPALIDPDARTPSFEDTGDTAFLYLTRYQLEGCKVTWDRDLVRVPVRISAGNEGN